MEMPSPGTGGHHRDTFNYGNRADVDMNSRDALTAGFRGARSIYQRDGLYDAYIRQQLQNVAKAALHPVFAVLGVEHDGDVVPWYGWPKPLGCGWRRWSAMCRLAVSGCFDFGTGSTLKHTCESKCR